MGVLQVANSLWKENLACIYLQMVVLNVLLLDIVKKYMKVGMVVYSCNPSSMEAEAGAQ
jgi:hypothetical protein